VERCRSEPWVSSLETGPDRVRRLRPLRVLLAGKDHRFVRVMAFLLSSRGYHVSHTRPEDVVDAAAQNRPDVVLLECAASRGSAARFAAQLGSLATAPGIVVATDGGETFWGDVRTVEKWTTLDELIAAIEAASFQRPKPISEAELRVEQSGI
jgi:DNA-binding response OmpR family regulator